MGSQIRRISLCHRKTHMFVNSKRDAHASPTFSIVLTKFKLLGISVLITCLTQTASPDHVVFLGDPGNTTIVESLSTLPTQLNMCHLPVSTNAYWQNTGRMSSYFSQAKARAISKLSTMQSDSSVIFSTPDTLLDWRTSRSIRRPSLNSCSAGIALTGLVAFQQPILSNYSYSSRHSKADSIRSTSKCVGRE